MDTRGQIKSFEAVVPVRARALLLGTYPSPKSFEHAFYYGHPQNRFWPLVAALAGQPVPVGAAARRAMILGSRLALWDVLERCTITGASDASISEPVPNNVAGLIAKQDIQVVFCNGAAAHRLYARYIGAGAKGAAPRAGTGPPAAVRLPSTSPANAAWSFERLLGAWAPLAPYLK